MGQDIETSSKPTMKLILIFFISFFLNLLYEICHSLLYKTCWEVPLSKYIYLILKAAVFDAVSITILFIISSLLTKSLEIIVFIVISLIFAFAWEKYSLKNKKWEYLPKMPLIFGVGITPFVQLVLTGLLSIYLASNL